MERDLDTRVKLFNEYLENGGYKKIKFIGLLKDLIKVKSLPNGNVDPTTVSPIVNAAMLAYEATQLTEPFLSDTHLSYYETLYQKSLFFSQTNIDTKEDFDQIFEKYNGSQDILFRGLSEAKYRLYNSLQRHWITEKLFDKEKTFETFLNELISNVKTIHSGVLTKYFEYGAIDDENDVAILSYLQHYGCPTPLLDWTYSFTNALYFATESVRQSTTRWEIDDYFCIYFLEEKYLESASLSEITYLGLKQNQDKFKSEFFEKLKANGVKEKVINEIYTDEIIEQMFVAMHGRGAINFMSKVNRLLTSPILYFSDVKKESKIKYGLNNNLNIVNQQGVFIWNSHPTKPLEHIANAEYNKEDAEYNYHFSECINIHKSLAEYVKNKIETLGITEEFIYPDPYFIAKAAFNKTVEEKQ